LKLLFVPEKIPRTITRKEWYEMWRWKRVTEKKLKEEVEKQFNFLRTYGTTMPDYQKKDLLDKLINPPLVLGPYQ
jgi:hypothetical protein